MKDKIYFSRACFACAAILFLMVSAFSLFSTGDIVEERVTGTGGGSSNFGWNITDAGDVNDDGTPDVLIGAPGADEAYLFYGPLSGTDHQSLHKL